MVGVSAVLKLLHQGLSPLSQCQKNFLHLHNLQLSKTYIKGKRLTRSRKWSLVTRQRPSYMTGSLRLMQILTAPFPPFSTNTPVCPTLLSVFTYYVGRQTMAPTCGCLHLHSKDLISHSLSTALVMPNQLYYQSSPWPTNRPFPRH